MERATEPISVQPRVQIMQMRKTRIVVERMRAALGQPIIMWAAPPAGSASAEAPARRLMADHQSG
jgi:hypothetical protein